MAIEDYLPEGLNQFLEGRNVFGVRAPQFLTDVSNMPKNTTDSPTNPMAGLLSPDQLKAAERDSLYSGLLGGGLQFALAPRNKNAGSVAPYILDALLAGRQTAQQPYADLSQSVAGKIELEKARQANLPEIYKKYQIAQNDPIDPFKGSFMDYETLLSQSKRPITTTNIGADKTYQQFFVDTYKNVKDKGNEAENSVMLAGQLKNLLNSGNLTTGFGAEAKVGFARFMETLTGQSYDPNTMDNEQFVGLSNRLILPEVKKLGVNPTDKDLAFIVEGSASLGKTIAGNLLMVEAIQLQAQRDVNLQRIANDWVNKNYELAETNPIVAKATLETYISKQREFLAKQDMDKVRILREKRKAIIEAEINPAKKAEGKTRLNEEYFKK